MATPSSSISRSVIHSLESSSPAHPLSKLEANACDLEVWSKKEILNFSNSIILINDDVPLVCFNTIRFKYWEVEDIINFLTSAKFQNHLPNPLESLRTIDFFLWEPHQVLSFFSTLKNRLPPDFESVKTINFTNFNNEQLLAFKNQGRMNYAKYIDSAKAIQDQIQQQVLGVIRSKTPSKTAGRQSSYSVTHLNGPDKIERKSSTTEKRCTTPAPKDPATSSIPQPQSHLNSLFRDVLIKYLVDSKDPKVAIPICLDDFNSEQISEIITICVNKGKIDRLPLEEIVKNIDKISPLKIVHLSQIHEIDINLFSLNQLIALRSLRFTPTQINNLQLCKFTTPQHFRVFFDQHHRPINLRHLLAENRIMDLAAQLMPGEWFGHLTPEQTRCIDFNVIPSDERSKIATSTLSMMRNYVASSSSSTTPSSSAAVFESFNLIGSVRQTSGQVSTSHLPPQPKTESSSTSIRTAQTSSSSSSGRMRWNSVTTFNSNSLYQISLRIAQEAAMNNPHYKKKDPFYDKLRKMIALYGDINPKLFYVWFQNPTSTAKASHFPKNLEGVSKLGMDILSKIDPNVNRGDTDFSEAIFTAFETVHDYFLVQIAAQTPKNA